MLLLFPVIGAVVLVTLGYFVMWTSSQANTPKGVAMFGKVMSIILFVGAGLVIIAGISFVLAAIGLVREVWGRARPELIGEMGGGAEVTESWGRYLVIGAWGAGLFLAFWLLGFFIAVPLFILSATKLLGTRWWVAITSTIFTTAFVYGMFELGLQIELYRGLLFS